MIFHILKKREWQLALERGWYEPESLKSEGFVHCSTREQTIATAERYFRGQPDLVLLWLDPSLLTSKVRMEGPVNPNDERSRELFPHVYGPINMDAVLGAVDFRCDASGGFGWPEEIS